MPDSRDRDIAIAERLQNALKEQADCSALAAFLEMYCRNLRGESPIDIRDFFVAGNFKHGRRATVALRGAEADGYVTKIKAEDVSKTKWQPTDKLIKLVQAIVDVEAPAWEEAERMRKLLAEARPGT